MPSERFASVGRVGVASLALGCLLTACQPRDASISLRFESPSTRASAASIRLRILEGGCSGAELYSSTFPANDPASASAPPQLGRGTYGFEVEARDASCRVIAETCVMRALPLEESVIEIRVPDTAQREVCAPAECMRGVCFADRPPDAGVPPPDAGDPPTLDASSGCSADGDCPGGRCRGGACCGGCWTGTECVDGTSAVACGAGGDACTICEAGEMCGVRGCAFVPSGSLSLSPVTSYVRVGGRLWSAGVNTGSQRGTLVSATPNVFARQDAAPSFIDVAAAQVATCGIDDSGGLHCWGTNANGLLGLGSTNFARTEAAPQRVGAGRWTDVQAGNNHFCAIRDDARLFCWGTNAQGQLGVSGAARPAPTEVEGAGTWRAVSPGDEHTCGIRTDGALFCWGSAELGRLGAPGAPGGPIPARVGTARDWVAISAGVEHTCGVRANGVGELFCWGTQQFGRLGNGESAGTAEAPVAVGPGRAWASVGAGQFHSCALSAGGEVFCWGVSTRGQTGLEPGDADVPTRVELDDLATAVEVGWTHTCAAGLSGGVLSFLRCWGEGTGGRLGDGSASDRFTPVRPTLEPAP